MPELPEVEVVRRGLEQWVAGRTVATVEIHHPRAVRRHTEVKRALLDQTLIGGVGNIYADEALWRARLHGARPTDKLTRAQVTALLDGVRDVLGEALAQGGTSFDSLYVDVNGQSGYFSRFLAVYGQGDRPCPRCGTPIRRESFMNRSSYSCPTCQPRPRSAVRSRRR
jgi:formamidopyrimidine-DNA glycosylase